MIDPKHMQLIRERLMRERGDLSLLALFEREDWRGQWDLLVAGGGLRDDELVDYQYIGAVMKDVFSPDEMGEIAQIVILPADYEPVTKLVRRVGAVNGEPVEMEKFIFYKFDIRRGLIFHAEPVEVGAARA